MTAPTTTTLDATREQRRDALIEIARLVADEDHGNVKPFTPVLPRLVPALASRTLDRDLTGNLFAQLVDAVTELARFCGAEGEWLASRELPDTDDMREAWHGRLDSDVQWWASKLLAEVA